MYMLMMVLDDSRRLNAVLAAWRGAGVHGITILESTGVHRLLPREEARSAYLDFGRMFGSNRVGHNTLLAIIDDVALADAAVAATEKLLGPITQPYTGIVCVWPLLKTWGFSKPDTADQADE
jgi:hypothetical protein